MATVSDQVYFRAPERRIDYPTSDGRPMGETDLHRNIMFATIETLKLYYAGQRVYVSGNILLFYQPGNRRRHVSPDVLVTKGLDQRDRNHYLLWQEGRPPNVVIEVTSESTREEDLDDKFAIYRDEVRVAEYFLYDPRGDYLDPPLQGYRLLDGEYQRIEPRRRPPAQYRTRTALGRSTKDNFASTTPCGAAGCRRARNDARQPKPNCGRPKPSDGRPKPSDGKPRPGDGKPKPSEGDLRPRGVRRQQRPINCDRSWRLCGGGSVNSCGPLIALSPGNPIQTLEKSHGDSFMLFGLCYNTCSGLGRVRPSASHGRVRQSFQPSPLAWTS